MGRFDLTRAKLYTVSPATIKIFKDLKTPVTAKLYISSADKMPSGMKTLEQDISGKLEEFKVASEGHFQYKVFHMEAANVTDPQESAPGEASLEAEAGARGIHPFQVQSIEADEMGVRLVYAALSLSYKEKPEEVIPQIMPESLYTLEYDLASRVFRMTLDHKPAVALVAPYQDQAMDPSMTALLQQIGGGKVPDRYRQDDYQILNRVLEGEGYEVSRISLTEDEPLPAGIRTLVMLEPMRLSDRQRYEMNRFLVSGGSVFLAVQNYEFEYNPAQGRLTLQGTSKDPEINPLLEAWGLEVTPEVLADEQNEMISLAGGAQLGPFALSVPVKTPIQILITSSQMNHDLSITSQLEPLFYLWGSAIKVDPVRTQALGLEVQTLFESSQESWTVPYADTSLNIRDFAPDKAISHGPYPLAIYVQGIFKDAFMGKPVPEWPRKEEEQEGAAAEEKKSGTEQTTPALTAAPGKLILTGDTVMFQKHLIQGGGHLAFFMNAIDVLTLGESLVDIRSKQPVDPTIGRLSSAEKILWRVFVTLLAPLAFAVFGALRMFLRNRDKQRYLKALA